MSNVDTLTSMIILLKKAITKDQGITCCIIIWSLSLGPWEVNQNFPSYRNIFAMHELFRPSNLYKLVTPIGVGYARKNYVIRGLKI